MSFGTSHKQILLRPSGGPQNDGTQLYDLIEMDVSLWLASVEYPLGAHAAGSDGKVYISKVARNKGNNPVGDAAVHWVSLVG